VSSNLAPSISSCYHPGGRCHARQTLGATITATWATIDSLSSPCKPGCSCGAYRLPESRLAFLLRFPGEILRYLLALQLSPIDRREKLKPRMLVMRAFFSGVISPAEYEADDEAQKPLQPLRVWQSATTDPITTLQRLQIHVGHRYL
jgi:hypothetical protein